MLTVLPRQEISWGRLGGFAVSGSGDTDSLMRAIVMLGDGEVVYLVLFKDGVGGGLYLIKGAGVICFECGCEGGPTGLSGTKYVDLRRLWLS